MRTILIILLILFVFCICAFIGYQLATQVTPQQPTVPGIQQPTLTPTSQDIPDVTGDQHDFVVVQIDQLDSQQPKLESVWFVSIFFMEDVNPTLTFIQLYSPLSTTEHARALERAFSLTPGGEPGSDFWRVLDSYEVPWEGYFMVDHFSAQYILEWANGPSDYLNLLADAQGLQELVQQTCQSISGMSLRQTAPFVWAGIAPLHFRSNMRMDIAMEYWTKMTSTQQPLRCDLILAP